MEKSRKKEAKKVWPNLFVTRSIPAAKICGKATVWVVFKQTGGEKMVEKV